MAVAAGLAVAIAGNPAGGTVTTAAFSPVVGSLLIAFGCARITSAGIPTISDTTGGTWTEIPASGVAFTNVKAKLWTHVVTDAASRTVTAVSAAATQAALGLVAVTGGNNADLSNFASATNAAGDPSVTLAAFQANSIGLGFMTGNAGATGSTPPVGYAEIYDGLPATNLRMSIVKDETSPGNVLAWVSASTDSIGYGLEIRDAVAVPATGRPKAWSGSAWGEKPAKVWTGSAWVEKPVKVWNGSAWVLA